MSSKFCKKSIVQFILFRFIHNKIIYYFLLFTLFSKFTYYFAWRNLPTNSNYFTKIYLLFFGFSTHDTRHSHDALIIDALIAGRRVLPRHINHIPTHSQYTFTPEESQLSQEPKTNTNSAITETETEILECSNNAFLQNCNENNETNLLNMVMGTTRLRQNYQLLIVVPKLVHLMNILYQI